MKRSFFILLLVLLGQRAVAQDGGEANLKAVFIYNFTRYIEWDSITHKDKNSFVIGIIGSTPVTASLTEIAKTKKVDNKKIIIRRFSKPEEIDDCQVLFIPKDISFSLASVLEKTGKGTLTVSEKTGFSKQGTALNFIIDDNDKLKFEANLKALFDAGLKASSQLLKLAIIVD